jgi:hypothetical protein
LQSTPESADRRGFEQPGTQKPTQQADSPTAANPKADEPKYATNPQDSDGDRGNPVARGPESVPVAPEEAPATVHTAVPVDVGPAAPEHPRHRATPLENDTASSPAVPNIEPARGFATPEGGNGRDDTGQRPEAEQPTSRPPGTNGPEHDADRPADAVGLSAVADTARAVDPFDDVMAVTPDHDTGKNDLRSADLTFAADNAKKSVGSVVDHLADVLEGTASKLLGRVVGSGIVTEGIGSAVEVVGAIVVKSAGKTMADTHFDPLKHQVDGTTDDGTLREKLEKRTLEEASGELVERVVNLAGVATQTVASALGVPPILGMLPGIAKVVITEAIRSAVNVGIDRSGRRTTDGPDPANGTLDRPANHDGPTGAYLEEASKRISGKLVEHAFGVLGGAVGAVLVGSTGLPPPLGAKAGSAVGKVLGNAAASLVNTSITGIRHQLRERSRIRSHR